MNTQINLIDVGAYGGLNEIWTVHHYLIGQLLLIDPRFPGSVGSRCGGNLEMFPGVIFDIEGQRNFYQYQKKACNSLFRITDDIESIMGPGDYSRFKLIKTSTINCTRLDTILDTKSFTFDFLKVDTQGSDFNVVKSMGRYLTQLVGLQVELYFKNFYQDAILFEEANQFLTEAGFTCFGTIRKDSNLFNDFVYLKLDSLKIYKLELIKKLFGVTDASIPYSRTHN